MSSSTTGSTSRRSAATASWRRTPARSSPSAATSTTRWAGSATSSPYYRRLDARHLWYELPIVVVVADGNGYRSIYAHFSDVAVKRGQMVKAGQFLGHEGRTGRATGCHVHYGLFSPLQTATFKVDPGVVKRMKVPRLQTARIDPMLVLPDRNAPPVSSASPVTDQPISP